MKKVQMEAAREDRKGPVRIGIGTREQFPALHSVGAETVRTHLWVRQAFDEAKEDLSILFRPEDTIVVVQPNLLSVSEIKHLAGLTQGFRVPSIDRTLKLEAETAIRDFRQIKPELPDVPRQENRGGKVRYPQPDDGQLASLVVVWQEGPRRHKEVERLAEEIMGEWVPWTFVRDKTKGKTGSAARKPTKEIEG